MNLFHTGVTALLLAGAMATGPQTPSNNGETGTAGDAPSFDCSAATGGVQEIVCNNTELGAFDRRLDDLYKQALAVFSADDIRNLRAYQRGWIKGRDDCWKASDVNACVVKEYQHRITELQIKVADKIVPAATIFSCGDGSSMSAYFYNDTELPALVLNRHPDQALLFRVISASGAKYLGQNVAFWQKGDSSQLEWNSEKIQCQLKEPVTEPG